MKHIKGTPKLTPRQRLVKALVHGKGVRLSHDDICELFDDDAINQAAYEDSARLQNCTSWKGTHTRYSPGDVPQDNLW